MRKEGTVFVCLRAWFCFPLFCFVLFCFVLFCFLMFREASVGQGDLEEWGRRIFLMSPVWSML